MNNIKLKIASVINFSNEKLMLPTKIFRSTLSINDNSLPVLIKPPVNFYATIILFITLLYFANERICDIFALLYPTLYGFNIYMRKQGKEEEGNECTQLLCKYWLVYGAFKMFELVFGLALSFVPFYFILRSALIYFLVRNKFSLSETCFDFMLKFCIRNKLDEKVNFLYEMVKMKLDFLIVDEKKQQ